MRPHFTPFSSHLELAERYWSEIITSNSFVVDMTAGNGHDTLKLAQKNPARLVAIDIQSSSIEKTKEKVKDYPAEVLIRDHSLYPDELDDESVTLAVYNLGYLPGGDKTITTLTNTTLISLNKMLDKLQKGGALSIMCYPGHEEGAIEQNAVLEWSSQLSKEKWMVVHTRFMNRKDSPSFLWVAKAL